MTSNSGELPERPERIRQLQSAVAPALALLAGMELGVFSLLGDAHRPAADLAASLGVSEARLTRLLNALVVAGLLELENGAYRNSTEAMAFLVQGSPRDISAEHELLRLLWQADLMTAASIRSGRPEAEHDFAEDPNHTAVAFQRGLLPSTRDFGRELWTRSKCRLTVRSSMLEAVRRVLSCLWESAFQRFA